MGVRVSKVRDLVWVAAKRLVPKSLLMARRHWLRMRSIRRVDVDLAGKSAPQIFSEIYRRGLWGPPADGRRFSSGHGSHLNALVEPYVMAIDNFVSEFSRKLSVVDLGCGDFNVGSKVRHCFSEYIACDIALEVLNENRDRYKKLDVEFCHLDMLHDDYPVAEVCIVRQVLQHLSNSDIQSVIPKLQKYQFLIVTEPIPKGDFVPNLDQPTGVSSRLARGIPSGVVLTEPPFLLRAVSSRELCSLVDEFSDARLVTTAFRLPKNPVDSQTL